MNLVALLKEVKNKGITLYLNDGKLAFKAPAGAMNKALKSQVVALKVELVELLEKRDSTETSKIEVIDRQPDDALVTSFPQQRLWFVDKLGRGSHQYNISAALKLSGTLKPEALEKAFSSIVSRHETLRTYFVAGDDGQPVQKIQNVDGFDVVTIDLSTIEAKNQQEEVIRYVDQETTYNFNLNSDFMLRVHVLKLSDAEHILLVTMHHIASDGWSVGVLITEFSTLYAAYAQGKGNPLAPLAVQYADYAHWQRNGIEGKVLDKQLSFWTNQLAGLPIIHSLPLDLPRPSKQRFAGHIYSCNMSKTKLDVFEQYCKDNGATLFMGLHAVFSVLLARYSNETDIVIGSPVANREQPEVEPLIGYFANTLVLRSDLSDKPTFNALLAQSKKTLLDAYANQQVPFEQVVEQLQPERSLSYSLLFQVMLVLQNNVQGSEELPDLTLSHVKQKNTVSKFDLTLNIMKNDEGLRVRWEYNTDLFKVETIKCLAEHFERLFEGLLSAPENNVFDVKMLSEPEYYQQLTTWNDTAVIYPKDKCIHELFEAQVEKTPNAIAAVFEDQKLNYSELNNKVNQLAHYLIEQKQVKPDTLVGICMERSLEMVIAIFAVLKAGGAYVPLDPDFPKARLAYMLQDANLSIVLTQIKLRGKISINDNQLEYLDDSMFLQHLSDYSTDNIDPLSQGLTSKHLAYVIYTSGSTGKPKGVMVPHSAVVHYLAHAVENYLTDNIVGSVLSSPLSFDATVTTLLTPLMAGRKIVILPEKQDLVVEGLINYFNAEYDYLFKITPAHLELLSTCNISGNAQHIVVIGGEQLTTRCLMPWKRDLLPNTIYVNEYGPTETAVGCSTYWIRELQDLEYDVHAVPIGQPINNIKFYVLYNGQPIPLGAIGELYIGGDGVTHGYLNNDELTNDKFVKNSQQTNQDDIIYRTGDLVRYRHDGHLEFIGRVDDQLKVRGYRIEVGEIEAQLVSHDKIKEAVVLAKGEGIKKHLVAYYTINQHAPKVSELKGWLKVSLAEYMIPTKFIEVDKFILTNNGKVDKKSLSEIAYVELGHNDKFSKNNNIEGQLSVIWCEILQLDKISINDNFFESGGNSLLSIEVQKAVSDRTGYQIELTDIFEYPTIKSLSGYLTKENELDERAVNTKSANTDSTNTGRQQDNDIAVIGMSGRFPDAANIDEFWQNISSGLESIQTFEDQQLLDCGASVSALNDPNYVKLGSLVEGMADFDAKYFSFTPREAELLDPQHRFMFECASDALEHAGYGDQSKFRDVGVFVGTSDSKYMMENLINNPEVLRNAGKMTYYGNSPGFLSTQLSYKLNLTGPSLNILTACSTALVGIHQACNSLNFNDCEMALAGGSSISLLKAKGYYFEEGGIDSLDGHCRPFDKDAQGTRAGSGAGVLLLKRLDKALADKDTIHAIIKGTAINNDAAEKVGYAAPSVGGQTDVIRKAMKKANVDASTIQYVETHGTGTSIGDPIEFRALQRAYGEQESGYCALGAVKANIGHLDTAAGAAGIIKVIQAIKNEQIPPSINFTQSNSQINFDKSPFYINTELKPWHSDNNVRRAGVSSFGVGGTNAHIIIEQAPVVEPSTSLRDTWLFPLSAMSKSALKVACDNLRNFLQQELQEGSNISLHDISYTLQLGRTKHAYSTAFACKSVEQAIKLLQNKPKIVRDKGERPSVVFMFPGQGSQYVNMAQQLYLTEPLFKTQFDLCAEKLLSISGEQLTNIIYPDAHMIQGVENDNDLLNQTHITQPALFTIEYCLARVMQSWGIEPDAMIGHSIGEYVAACLAGVFNLSDALKLVSARGRLMQKVAPGSMLSVSMTVEQLEPLLTQTGTCLAGINSVSNCVASGSDESLNRLKVLLDEQEIDYRTLHTSHAFHSKMMDVILPDFKNVIEQITLQPPTLLYVSNVTGNYITPEQVQDPQYWVEHLRGTVRFADGIETILADREFLHESKILIEVGPGISLSALAKKNPRSAEYTVVSTMRHPKEPVCDMVNLQNALGKLWGHGITVDWQAFHHEHPGRRVPLPTYPYEKVRYWVNSVKNPQRMATNKEEKLPMDQWWNLPTWKQKPLIKIDRLLKNLTSSSWLLIMDDSGVAEEVAKSLINAGQRVLRAYSGKSFSRISDDEYSLDLTNEADYLALLRAACSAAKITRVIHFASIEPVGQNDKYDIEDFWSDQESGALSALYTIKAIINAELVDDCKIDFITNDVAKISGEEIASPGKATITSLCKVAPQEYSELECHHIDVKLHHNHGKEYIVSLSQNIIGELLVPERCSSIALRGFQRWEKQYETGVIEPDMPAAKTLKDDGVYLITGGLGNIGLLLAGYISKTVKNAKLILVGRSHFPAGEDWDDIMKSQAEESICHKIDQIQIMQARGADVSVLTADVADLVQMQTLFETVEERFGAINGVIHCAGQLHGSMKALIETGKQDFEKQYSSKVNGVMVLNELLSTRQPDFCILMSSLASVLGGLGFSAYAAANIFMDAFVQRKHDLGDDSWISVNWDGWNFLSADNVDLSRNSFGMTPEEGELAFEQVLAGAYFPQLINSTGSLDYRLSQWIDKTETVHQSVLYERPELDTDYVKPTNEVEEKLVVIWQNILGIDLIGIEDHFFDLGGDSLVATRVISAIRKVFSVNESIFSIRDFFESPVIEHIAEKISVSTVDTLVEDKKTQFIEAGKVVDEGVF